MINVLPRNIIRFVFIILFQALILNNIQLGGYLNPYLYILFILLLPFETPKWMLLIIAFITGFTIDIFTNTPGIHTFSTVLIAFIRPFLLAVIAPRDGYESGTFPRIYYYGLNWFTQYTLLLTLIHHLSLFYLEVFSFNLFFHTFFRVILSTMFSSCLIILSQYFIFRK